MVLLAGCGSTTPTASPSPSATVPPATLAPSAAPTPAGSQDAVSIYRTIEDLGALVGGNEVYLLGNPGEGTTSEELMRNADMALYCAKSDGGGVHRFFEREMDR